MPASTPRRTPSRPLTLTAAVAAAALVAVAAPRAASACSCARPAHGARSYFKQADTVFVGRVVRVVDKKKGRTFHFAVLATLKGKVGARYELVQPLSPCDPSFRSGQTRVVLLRRGNAGLCSGNFSMAGQLPDVPTYLRLARKNRLAKRAELAAALAELRPYLHSRKHIPLASKTLPRKLTLRVGASWMTVTRTLPKHALIVRAARCVGRVCAIKGSYPREGVVYSVLVERRGGKLEVIARAVAERKHR